MDSFGQRGGTESNLEDIDKLEAATRLIGQYRYVKDEMGS
jgi:hypothetical protein